MLSSAKKACFLNKKWLSLFALSQTCKQVINSTISHFGHDTNHNFDNETPSHFVACSLRSPMKHIIKYLRAHWGNSAQQIPAGKIIIYFLSTESTRLKLPTWLCPFPQGESEMQVKVTCLTENTGRKGKKKKKSLNFQSGWVMPDGRCGGLVVHGISCCLALHVFR